VGSDVDPVAIKSARQIVASNDFLPGAIECRLQKTSTHIFKGIIKPGEVFHLSICNPPFHSSLEEARAGTDRKWKNLGIKKGSKTSLNFGGQNQEIWCEGGEGGFVYNMIEESAQMPASCLWYSTLISKSSNLQNVYKSLKKVEAAEVKTIEMAQGQKVSRIVAWTFFR
jgi:23S rRNA (adenine1618-N6)-methyltransferase